MKNNLKTRPRQYWYSDDMSVGAYVPLPPEIEEWFKVFEAELRKHILDLLQMRAGGRYTIFEAGMMYQSCLTLGLKNSRLGIGEQENYWESLVTSCRSREAAEAKLREILSEGGV